MPRDGAKMNEIFVVELPWFVEALEDFNLHIDIDLIKWKEDKMPKTRLFAYPPKVKIAEIV